MMNHRGYLLPDGIAVLEMDELLPKSKVGMMPEQHEHWLALIHGAIDDLSKQGPVPRFEKAMVGLRLTEHRGKRSLRWDTSNRAINLVLNNLKGVFFEDDDYSHMAFTVVGNQGDRTKTVIYVGDLTRHAVEIMRLIIGQ